MTDNMNIWSAVEKTDPKHTKTVNQRGGFTAISANYQIMRATEQFGPIGIGWGYDTGAPIFQGDFVIIPLTFWHGERAHSFGPIYGCCQIINNGAQNKNDSDAPKKATTDAITKALSQLGFNADVFMGKYDDNKYMAEITEEFRAKPDPAVVEANILNAIKTIETETSMEGLGEYFADLYRNSNSVAADPRVIAAKDVKKLELAA